MAVPLQHPIVYFQPAAFVVVLSLEEEELVEPAVGVVGLADDLDVVVGPVFLVVVVVAHLVAQAAAEVELSVLVAAVDNVVLLPHYLPLVAVVPHQPLGVALAVDHVVAPIVVLGVFRGIAVVVKGALLGVLVVAAARR